MFEATNWILCLFVEEEADTWHSPAVSHFSSGSWQKKIPQVLYSLSKTRFYSWALCCEPQCPVRVVLLGHQGAQMNSSLRPQVTLQNNVLYREAPWLLSCSPAINSHKYLITHRVSWPWPQHSTGGWHSQLGFFVFNQRRTLFASLKLHFRNVSYIKVLKRVYMHLLFCCKGTFKQFVPNLWTPWEIAG